MTGCWPSSARPRPTRTTPERAIRAALEIREAAEALGIETTVGVNTGEVYVGGVGSEQHQESTVIGPVVNLASRLQEAAEPGQIIVGEATYRHTQRAFQFESLTLPIKGMTDPVPAYRVERPRTRPEKVRGIEGLRAELVGRQEEFAKLQDALQEVRNGRGQLASLVGEAGVGKSRLIAELKERAVSTESPSDDGQPRPLVLEGRCLELGMAASYWPFIDMFREYFGFRSGDSNRDRARRLVTSLNGLAEQDLLPQERIEEIGPLFGRLFSIKFETEWDERLADADPERIKQQTFMALRDVVLALAKQQPLILVFEDLHWSDELSIDLISMLMESLTLAPLFLICVYRPEQEHKCSHLGTIASRKCPERYTELRLHELTPKESRRLIESLLAIDQLPDSTRELILEKSGGNPFFVEEVVRSLIDAGMVYREGDVWRAKEGIEEVSVPESIQSVILSRVDRLEEELRHVLQSASVIGHLFRRRLLERITEEEKTLEKDLWELDDHDFIYQERVVPEEEYSFKHVLTQETIYQSILRKRRTVFPQLVAESMESLYQDSLEEYYEQLAYHYDRSGHVEKAIDYLLKAGGKARQSYLNDDAIRYLERALNRLKESGLDQSRKAWRLEAITGLGKIYHDLGREKDAEKYLQEAVGLARESAIPSRELVRLYHWLGDALFWQGRYGEVIPLAEEGLELLGEDTESVEAALMHSRLCVAHSQLGDQKKPRECNERNEKFLERLPYSEELIPAYRNVAQHYSGFLHEPEHALSWLTRYRERAEEQGDLRGVADARRQTGDVLKGCGELAGARVEFEQALELFTKIHDLRGAGWCLNDLTGAHLAWGDLDQAEAYARRTLEAAREGDIQVGQAWALHFQGVCEYLRGQWQRAIEASERSAELFRAIGNHAEGLARCQLACAYGQAGRRAEAVEAYERAAEQAASLEGRGIPAVVLASALHGLEAAHDPQTFRSFCDDLWDRYPELGAPNLARLYTKPADVREFAEELVHDRFESDLSADWFWDDPFEDCSYSTDGGLVIRAGPGRLLLHPVNQSAPRVVRTVHGDFALEVVCTPVSNDATPIGGLFLRDESGQHLLLNWGLLGRDAVGFWSRETEEMAPLIGRGHLGSPDGAHLRLERVGGTVRALCKLDGEWHLVGSCALASDSPVQVGLFAEGMDDYRLPFHPEADPTETAIRFESFRLWC